MKSWQKKLIKIVNPLLKQLEPVHGSDHSKRVFQYCSVFAKDYKNVDMDVLFVAAWLHDLGYKRLKNGMGNHGHFSADFVNSLLQKLSVPSQKFNLIKQIIIHHDEKEICQKNLPMEVYIFHDADKIDGLGALGTSRQLVYSGGVGKKIWDPSKKRNSSLPYGGNFSAIHTILDYHLKIRFYTKKVRKIAQKRKEFTKLFIKNFFQEWDF